MQLPEGATKTVLGRGGSGEITGYTGRIRALEFGGQTFKNVPTRFPDSSSGTTGINGRQGNLGSGILRRFKAIYDYSRKHGSPRLASAAYGARLWKRVSSSFIDLALKILDGLDYRRLPRYGDVTKAFPANMAIDRAALDHEQKIEKKQADWLKKKGFK